MYYIRALVYKIGLRPKPGSIFHSPSRHYELMFTPEERWMHVTFPIWKAVKRGKGHG